MNQEVLKLRFGLVSDYDVLAHDTRELRRLWDELPDRPRLEQDPVAAELLLRYDELLDCLSARLKADAALHWAQATLVRVSYFKKGVVEDEFLASAALAY